MPAVSGWGGEVFTGYTHWWIVPVLACHAGALLGASLYWLLLTTEVTEVGESLEDDVVKDIRKDKISPANLLHVSCEVRLEDGTKHVHCLQYSDLYHHQTSSPPSTGADAQCQTLPDLSDQL